MVGFNVAQIGPNRFHCGTEGEIVLGAGPGADDLARRLNEAGIEAVVLSPRLEDFNEDLRLHGSEALRTLIRPQLVHEDAGRFMAVAT